MKNVEHLESFLFKEKKRERFLRTWQRSRGEGWVGGARISGPLMSTKYESNWRQLEVLDYKR